MSTSAARCGPQLDQLRDAALLFGDRRAVDQRPLVGVIGASRVLESFLFSVAPTDPLAIGGAALLMLLVSAVACYIPARRAADGDPVEALRVE